MTASAERTSAHRLPKRLFVRRPGTIPELDGLRAIAITLVVLRHSMGVFYNSTGHFLTIAGWDVATPATNGWMGVDLFFVLSGFLIAHHLIRRSQNGPQGMTIGRYLLKRVLRIVPAYYVFLLVVVAGLIPGYAVAGDISARLGYHLLFLQDYLPSNIVVAFWSLGVEEKFYLLAPFIVLGAWRLPRRPKYTLLLLLALVPMALRASAWIGSGPIDYTEYFYTYRSPFHFTFEGLLLGTVVAHLFHDRDHYPWLNLATARAALATGSVIVVAHLVGVPLFDTIGTYDVVFLESVLAVGFALVVLGTVIVATDGPGIPILTGHRLFVISVLSYSIYLTHMVFMDNTYATIDSITGFSAWPDVFEYALYLPFFVALSVVSALALHFAAERPGLRLKDAI